MLIKVNGRERYFNYLSDLKRVSGSKSRWTVKRLDTEYHIEGGKHAGGRRNEWFVDGVGSKAIYTTSLMDSLRLLDGM
jgi:hypothetical protein